MLPVLLNDILPCASLQDYVRKYQVFRFVFDKNVAPPVKFHAPRPEHSVTFYIRDAQKFSYCNGESIVTYPPCVINGMYTIPIHRYGGHDFCGIKVVFQPSALFQITAFPLQKLTNQFINAEEIWGKEISLVCEKLKALNDLNKMLATIETFLKNLVKRIAKPPHPIDEATYYILYAENGVSLDWLASQSCLSIRQFIRKFEERVGTSPKTFQRIVRFDKAFRMKNNHPHLDWLYIAIACGFHDYQHLVKDFKEFTLLTPPAFYEIEKRSPERSFGLYEG